ncbi:MAG: hypothetical protein IT379_41945 [Deltaproteobacteria bacterium]|nr:hypothetical protein [Deltaproteobacteria bacterium]
MIAKTPTKQSPSRRIAVDQDKVRAATQGLSHRALRDLVERAIDLLPQAKLGSFIRGYASPADLRPDSARSGQLVANVRRFHAAALRGDFYESFNVNSKNWQEKSPGTRTFIAECNRLLDRCAKAAEKGQHAEAGESFELVFDLVRRIDGEGGDEIVFFADEHGSWQLGIPWERVLPAWFGCLATTASPDEYAQSVRAAIHDFAEYHSRTLITAARKVASPAQRSALRNRGSASATKTRQA